MFPPLITTWLFDVVTFMCPQNEMTYLEIVNDDSNKISRCKRERIVSACCKLYSDFCYFSLNDYSKNSQEAKYCSCKSYNT